MNKDRNVVVQRIRCAIVIFATCLAAGSAFSADDDWLYVTRPGDTLIGIAERYLVNAQAWRRVQSRNHVADPYKLKPGRQLRIPSELLRTDPVVAEVLMVNGQASSTPTGGGQGQTLAAGASLHAGDSVRVEAGSNLSLRFPDGSRLLVLEKSRFKLIRAERLGRTDVQRIRIEMSEGSVESSVAPMSSGASQYEIKTPALRMAVRGTHFRAAADPGSGQSRSEVLAGRVNVSGASKAVILDQGFGSYATPGEPPQTPRRLAPAPDLGGFQQLYERLPLRFTWKPVQTAHGYRAQVFDGAANLMLDGVFKDNAARWADLPDGHYVLRVRSIGDDFLEGLDAEQGFTLKARPEPPFSGEPTGKSYGDSTQFNWTEAAGIGLYHFQLGRDSSFSELLADEPALTTHQITRALRPGRYYWRVASIDGRGDHGPFGDVTSFEQRAVPASPQTEKSEISDDQIRFRWREGEPGQHYLLQLANTPDFAQPLLEKTTDKAAVAMPRPDAGEYFMRVKAIDADGFAGPFGATQRITVPGTLPWWLLLLLLPFVH